MTSNKNNLIVKSMFFFFSAFLLLMPFLGGLKEVNNIFHMALILSVIYLISAGEFRRDIFKNKHLITGLVLTSIFLFYFSISGLWSANAGTVVSDLTHSFYIIFFILIFYIITQHDKKNIMLALMFASVVILCILTLIYINKKTLLYNRLQNGFPFAPENVIDMAGYYGIGIFCGLILLRETGKKWLYLPIALLFFAILLTQSRGPLFSLIVALAPLLLLIKRLHRKDWLIIALLLMAIILAIIFSNGYNVLLHRIESSYSQSFIRFGIWEDALSYVQQKPWFGWGFGQEINFVNEIGQRVHTTHSLYLATLLKGGVVGGVLLLMVIVYGAYMAWQHFKAHRALEASMLLFSLLFYTTQGMFVIGNPGTPWVLFWFPLALVMAQPGRR
ncbi:O-antigen ligase family protein [Erwinia persicina]|uniref:Lipopolysaccharide biosynthesis protein n=1 Tax=Erwinia persicina TaxID=55211 RepID=A0A4V5U9E4_9GAMM|nr:O-antigen ligase family protein [Erwinia persicina]MBD8108275.1 O-antigen ligase family protein [Erwinia persicina]MBD8211318.1 O-antigen ligase family protein [Erwinia persicina]TKJ87627.1 lipopolysaccharide biosynthesis protein [Erwinia persicina]